MVLVRPSILPWKREPCQMLRLPDLEVAGWTGSSELEGGWQLASLITLLPGNLLECLN